MDETCLWKSNKGGRLMALSVTFQIPLHIGVSVAPQGGHGQVTVPLSVGVSIGEPKVVTQQPQFDPQIRCCAQCGHNYRDTSPQWNIYPQCGICRSREEEEHRLQYERELASPRRVPSQPARPRLPSFNEVNNVNWQEEGF